MANLKRSIVVVNQYTVKDRRTGKGSRGGSPGDYVVRYMARDLATETIEPVRRTDDDVASFITRYMARESATEAAGSVPDLKDEMRHAQGLGGRSFGYGQISLSDQGIKAAAADIQRLYDQGHTVLKTVISFDQEYLREHGIISPDFVCEERGDYRGNVDQLKLRMGIMHGLERMSSQYDDLRYAAVLQFDTEHVHCHLAMVDAGRGTLAGDGTQRGKLDARAKSFLRRGIDAWLDEKQTVAHLSNDVGFERRNVTSYVKRWAHQQMLRESMPQFLIACLPEDRRLWRAGTNDARMRKPNAIVNQMVAEMLDRPDSPMAAAMAAVQAYANERRESEGLRPDEWRRLVDNGRDQITGSAVNGVYALLRSLPQDVLQVRTPMLDVMSMDYEQMAAELTTDDVDPIVDFGFKLRSYSSRLEHHTERREYYHERVREWDQADAVGAADPGSVAMRRFWEEEEEYHSMLMSKYQKFLPFAKEDPDWYRRWNDVATLGERVLSLEMMTRDDSLRRYKDADEAEARGLEIYGQKGASLLTQGATGRQTLEDRARRARETYGRRVEDLRVQLASSGLVLSVTDDLPDPDQVPAPLPGASPQVRRPSAEVSQGSQHDFELVKGLDLHHLRYDFASDVPVGQRAVSTFVQRARLRAELLEDAVAYLRDSDQEGAVSTLPLADVALMGDMATTLSADPGRVLHSEIAMLASQSRSVAAARRSRTVQLGLRLSEELDQVAASQARDALVGLVPASYRVPGRVPEAPVREETGLE